MEELSDRALLEIPRGVLWARAQPLPINEGNTIMAFPFS